MASVALTDRLLHHTLHGHAGPPVVLLHGLGSSSTDWPAQHAVLEPRYRVVAVDLPGHGDSPLPDGTLTIERMARDVTALLERLASLFEDANRDSEVDAHSLLREFVPEFEPDRHADRMGNPDVMSVPSSLTTPAPLKDAVS